MNLDEAVQLAMSIMKTSVPLASNAQGAFLCRSIIIHIKASVSSPTIAKPQLGPSLYVPCHGIQVEVLPRPCILNE